MVVEVAANNVSNLTSLILVNTFTILLSSFSPDIQ